MKYLKVRYGINSFYISMVSTNEAVHISSAINIIINGTPVS